MKWTFAEYFNASDDTTIANVGIVLGMCVAPSPEGIKLTLDPEKACKWIKTIDEALERMRLDAGAADKLSGRLMWSTQHLFHRCICLF